MFKKRVSQMSLPHAAPSWLHARVVAPIPHAHKYLPATGNPGVVVREWSVSEWTSEWTAVQCNTSSSLSNTSA